MGKTKNYSNEFKFRAYLLSNLEITRPSQLKLLDYVLKVHKNNEFFPREHIQQGRNKFAAQQRELSKEFEGLC